MCDETDNTRRIREIEQIALTPFGEQYADSRGEIVDAEAFVIDLLANLRHFCDSRSLDFAELDRIAHDHYTEETVAAREARAVDATA